jgi:nicotinamide-nucleotide amidase
MAEQNIIPNVTPIEIKLEDFFTKVLSAIGKTTDEQIAELLSRNKVSISVAESLTGGLISSRLTSIAGSSDFFVGGIVCYNNRVKVMDVGVPASLISKHGPVSKEVAIAMAEGIRKRMRTDIGLAATGVAGPKPVPPAPVGQIFIALADASGTEWKDLFLQGIRADVREKTVQAALGLLWLHLGGQEVVYKI